MSDEKPGAPPPIALPAIQNPTSPNIWDASITLSEPPSGTTYDPTYNLVPNNVQGYPMLRNWTVTPMVSDASNNSYPVSPNPAHPNVTNPQSASVGVQIGLPFGLTQFGPGLTIQIRLQYSTLHPSAE